MTEKDPKRKKNSLKLKVVFIFLILYIGSYIIFSYFGSYFPTQSGKVRYEFGLSVTDVRQWQPKFIYGHLFRTIDDKTTYRGNIMGFVYAPLVVLDQKYAHTSERFIFTEVPLEVEELIKKLNSWNKEELDVLEHPDKYSGRIASGETEGWVNVHKQKLEELGFVAKWNSNKKSYELVNYRKIKGFSASRSTFVLINN